jgi:hypothetical protein
MYFFFFIFLQFFFLHEFEYARSKALVFFTIRDATFLHVQFTKLLTELPGAFVKQFSLETPQNESQF